MLCASNGEIELFVHPHSPAPLLLVLGSAPSAELARGFALQCGFRVADRPDTPEAAQALIALVATQGEGDEAALAAALAGPARDVLLVASRRKADGLRAAMRLRGVPEQRLAAIQAPAGPDIGAHSPAHIALAAVAGAVACWQKVPKARPAAAAPAIEAAVASYVNPVCGAAVVPAEALHVLRHAGQAFYFCCDGCKLEFERDPDRYAAIQASRQPAAPVLEAA
jgi:xanthine dehydrogenase accessory factor